MKNRELCLKMTDVNFRFHHYFLCRTINNFFTRKFNRTRHLGYINQITIIINEKKKNKGKWINDDGDYDKKLINSVIHKIIDFISVTII